MKTIQRTILALVLGAVICSGCILSPKSNPAFFVQPNIAVMKFENRAPFPLSWDLGDGMAEILIDRLVATRRFHVIERAELDAILGEHRLQASGATRTEARTALGRLKNVQYLVRGTVTDFGHVSTAKGFLSGASLGIRGSGAAAIMGMTFSVVDVESGETIFSEHLEKAIRASSTAVEGNYKGVTLGGSVFFKTPLGKATAEVMDKAVEGIIRKIASVRWWPRIADISDSGQVILNGGKNRKVLAGYEYDVLEQGKVVVDPVSGDRLGRLQAKILARIKVIGVSNLYSTAEFLSGDAMQVKIGLICRPCQVQKITTIPTASGVKRRSGASKDQLRRH